MFMSSDDWRIYATLRNMGERRLAEKFKTKHKTADRLMKSFSGGLQEIIETGVTMFGDEYGHTEKFRLPADCTDDDIQYLIDTIKIEWSSPYDCTGWFFTAGIDVYRTPSAIFVYHRVAIDV